ncbi:MAG TPA: hypothetical protein VJM47_09125 [Nitrosospira sp.]|nr:hypothetical protein [Nitrosospira sp.]
MSKYGSDKPDMRVPLVLTELTDVRLRSESNGIVATLGISASIAERVMPLFSSSN